MTDYKNMSAPMTRSERGRVIAGVSFIIMLLGMVIGIVTYIQKENGKVFNDCVEEKIRFNDISKQHAISECQVYIRVIEERKRASKFN
jgi:hypothetical protein